MNKEEIFSTWAPDGSLWAPWTKPVLFAHLDSVHTYYATEPFAVDVSWAPPPEEKTALVINLPGAEGVFAGVALAERGYRPVPLYNAIPAPFRTFILAPGRHLGDAVVDVLPILQALRHTAERLAAIKLPDDAPPAFLLDANRAGGRGFIKANDFDNRSVSFTTDFPSANFLLSHGIHRAVMAQRDATAPPADLAHTLRRWQEGGIKLERLRLDLSLNLEPFEVPKPSWFGAMFQRALAGFGLRRSGSGGFGRWVPDTSSGG